MRQLFFGLLVLCCACSSPEFTVWSTVPSDAKVVLEVNRLPSFVDDSLLQSTKSLCLPKQAILISLFSIKGPLVAHIPVVEKKFRDWVTMISKGGGFTTEKKEEGVELFELKRGNQKWYLAYKAPILLISENTLVESLMKLSKENLFKENHSDLFHLATVESDSGTVYVNQLPLTDFKLPEAVKKIKSLENQVFSAALDMTISGSSLTLTGFSPYAKNKLPIEGQRPVASQIWPMISEDTRFFIQFGLSDIFSFAGLKKDTTVIENYLSSEIAYSSFSNSPDDFILILKSSNAQKLHSLLAAPTDRELQAENVDRLRKGFEMDWLKNRLPPMNLKYVWRHDPYILLAATTESLIKAKEDIDSDETWGKSHNFLLFNERHLRKMNGTVIVKEGDSDTTKSIFSPLFANRSARMSSFQWSTLDDAYYTNVNIDLGDASFAPMPRVENISISEVMNYTPVFNKAFDNVHLFIEGRRLLTLRNMEQKILWGRAQEEVRINDFTNVDFYRNGKWQFFYATESKLFVVDRLGRTVSDYPIDLPFKASFAQVVDYDNSRRYRWMTGGGKEVYLYNKSGKALPGWKPREMEDTILCSPQHFRTGGTDYFIVPLKNGEVHLLRRTGKEAYRFPVTIAPPLPHYFIKEGDLPSLYFITSKGELFTVSFSGEKNSVQLTIPEGAVITPLSTHEPYYVAQNGKTVVAFKEANMLFEIENPLGSLGEAGWLRSNGRMYFTFFDKFRKLCHVVNEKGKALKDSPFQTQLPLKSIEANGRDYIFSVNDNKVTGVNIE